METFQDLPILTFESPDSWREWLLQNHTQPTGVWLTFAKKSSKKVSISYDEALEEALCYGWIDALKRAYDEDYWLQKFVPRGPKSMWSKINVAKVENLIKTHKMQPAGLATVETAKKNGMWLAAYDSPSTTTVPDDFQAALNANPQAKKFFETLNRANVYGFCWRIQTAKKPETRKARIDTFIAMLNRGEKLH